MMPACLLLLYVSVIFLVEYMLVGAKLLRGEHNSDEDELFARWMCAILWPVVVVIAIVHRIAVALGLADSVKL